MEIRCDLKGLKEVEKSMNNLAKAHLPSAIRRTLNELAGEVKTAEVEMMKKVFDRPTAYTLNSLFVRYASKSHLVAEVGFKDWAGKGTPAARYISPQVHGGKRDPKRFEMALRRMGILPAGMFAVPGSGAQLDGNGNMSRGQIVKILSYFNAFGEQGYTANMTDKKRARMKKGTKKSGSSVVYFVARGSGRTAHLHPGIYARHGFAGWGSSLRCILLFVKTPVYQKRLPFEEVGQKVCNERSAPILNEKINEAISRLK